MLQDCKDWIGDCCEYTCYDHKDSKENFFLNRLFDKFFETTTIPPFVDPYDEYPI